MLANTTSEALQSNDTDLAAAAMATDDLKQAVLKFSNDCEYNNMLDVAAASCTKLGTQPHPMKSKRKRTVPAALQSCVTDSFLTEPPGSFAAGNDNKNLFKRQLKVDFF